MADEIEGLKEQLREQGERMDKQQVMLEKMLKFFETGSQPVERIAEELVESNGDASGTTRHEIDMMARMSGRMAIFKFDEENDKTFSRWFERYGEIFTIDLKSYTDKFKVRLLLDRLDEDVYTRFASKIKPAKPSEGTFEATIGKLKALFDIRTSIVTERYKC